MSVLKRIYNYVRQLIFGTLDKLESPEVILDQAVREMRESQVKNRERAVQAITQRNNLAQMVDKEEKIVRDLEAKAGLALKQGNRELARTLLRDKSIRDGTLQQLRSSLQQAEETSEAVKEAIRREDEKIRVKTAEALRLKTSMKQAQIQIEINKALDGFQFEDAGANFDRAEERITAMRSEAEARAEIAKTSVNSRLMQLEDAQVDVETDRALEELEAKMGLAPATTNGVGSPVTVNPQESDIDRQLRELEQKLSQQ